MQAEASECGLACLAMIAGYHGLRVDLPTLRRKFGVSLQGTNLRSLIDIGSSLDLRSRALRTELPGLRDIKLPAILHWDLKHFVVLTCIRQRLGKRRYEIIDPAQGQLQLDERRFSESFTGVAVELSPSIDFRPRDERTKVRLSMLWRRATGLWSTLGYVFALSAILQLIALALPFFLQLAVDGAYLSGDSSLLNALALGFLGVTAVSALVGWTRSQLLVSLSHSLSFQVLSSLNRHLLRLPLSWFEKRHVGDIISRFSSTRPITELISNGFVTSILDGVMSVTTLGVMLYYSPGLTGIPLVALALYALLRFSTVHVIRAQNVDVIAANARENSNFIESLRGATTIKAFGQEANRLRMWQDLKARAVNSEIRLGRSTSTLGSLEDLVLGSERILFIYIAISLVMSSSLTLGMVFALQAYKMSFLNSATQLVEQWIQLRILNVHLERISDIVHSPEETSRTGVDTGPRSSSAALVLKNVSFRYSPTSPDVIKNIDLTIPPGEIVVLTGPSGGGKSTLLKIMMGLHDPTWGEVQLGGIGLNRTGKDRFRSDIGCVLQDDALFAGSLAENIAFFDPQIDMDRVRDAAAQAEVLADIQAMPMSFETLVGDMGSALSGGQKQRVLLARALYKRPAMLFLDESTSNLDLSSEEAVMRTIMKLPITRVISAHRPTILSMIPRVIVIGDGMIRGDTSDKGRLASIPAFAQALNGSH
jgi:ATP-binding cassette subfamily B protein RaxB